MLQLLKKVKTTLFISECTAVQGLFFSPVEI